MKILFINHEFPPVGGGAATITKELFRRFELAGHQVHLLTGTNPAENSKITTVNTDRKHNSEGSIIEFIKFIFRGFLKLNRLHKKYQPNVVFAFFTIPSGMLAMFFNILFKTPYIVSIRGGDIPGFQLGKKHAILQKLANPFVRLICKNATKVHVNSKRLYKLTIENAIDLDKVEMLPNGINISSIAIGKKVTGDKIKLLFTGRLSKQKNLDTFLKALVSIKNGYEFIIVGNGPEKDRLKTIVEENRLMVKFLDWKSRTDLQSLYRESQIFILPSLDEGMSNSALEAVTWQCALLSSKNAHLQWKDQELLNNWVVEDYLNPKAWQKALERIINNQQYINEASIRMKQFVIENNDWELLFPKYEEMVLQCVE